MPVTIDIKGFGINLSLYEIDVEDMTNLEKLLISDENMFIPDENEEGFRSIQGNDEFLIGKFKSINYYNVDVADSSGENISRELKKIEECGIIIFKDMLCLYGKNSIQKEVIYKLTKITEKTFEKRKFTQDEMKKAESDATEIKSIQLDNIPHNEITKLKMSGKMEDIYGIRGLDLHNSTIKNFTGRFSSKEGNQSVKVSEAGSIQIYKIKSKPISIENIRYFIDLFCDLEENIEEN